MADIIRLLPDSVANQIAAGEVVQRPSSAVKELLENAVDAGAREIKLIVKESGKALIRVVDNGHGMSERDARMCFERHATSKIKNADDLLAIRTLGFRGEALASIASVAQVEIKTRKIDEEIGVAVTVHGSEFKFQTPFNCPIGTDISVKNLFYNVPARRNFLKSNTLELKYVVEEFYRVALVHPDITFSFFNNDKLVYQLVPSNVKQRIVSLFGSFYQQRLIPVEQESNLVNITGFIGKPEFAKKTRGEQYFFTNGRFIKNPYLNHAVEMAFRELIPTDAFPTYFIYLEVDPQTIDINIHPTKTEINFQDAKSIYAILNSAIKLSIGKFNLSPTLDFETEKGFDLPPLESGVTPSQPEITVNPGYNPFEKKVNKQQELPLSRRVDTEDWQKLYDPLKDIHPGSEIPSSPGITDEISSEALGIFEGEANVQGAVQLFNRYIISSTGKGVVIINQQNAHERILYEKFLSSFKQEEPASQHLLMPEKVTVSLDDAMLLKDLIKPLNDIGFEINEFGNDTFLIHRLPLSIAIPDLQGLIESLLEDFKQDTNQFMNSLQTKLARAFSKKAAIKAGKRLQQEEMRLIMEGLFACNVPETTPDGKLTMIILPHEELQKKFKT